ncbi:hypothetical protein PIB30_082593 [Stylosanthes scabra]|uniref:Uncharacterized protein n=1 Tax=Stylosanthes scabra TaxID=79078 RepID=A0ABU6WSY8_9FABA|nr:hypothetical protein [Stylosanthes scabra]
MTKPWWHLSSPAFCLQIEAAFNPQRRHSFLRRRFLRRRATVAATTSTAGDLVVIAVGVLAIPAGVLTVPAIATSATILLQLPKRSAVNKVNWASSKGGFLHTGGSATIPKTRARMTRSLDRQPTNVEVFRETHTWKRDKSIVEKRADDLLTEFSANLKQATQQAQEEGDESAGTVDPNVVWRQTLSEPYKNWSGYGGSSTFDTSSHASPAGPKVVDLREQVHNLMQSLESQGQVLQQQIDKVRSLKKTLAERDAREEEHLRRLEEMQCQIAAYYGPLRPASSTAVGGSGSSTGPPLPPHPPPPPPPAQPDQGPADDDDDYEDA